MLALLDQYPYGCTEQVTSKALPLLSLAPVADLLGLATQTRVDERVAGAIDKVLSRQTGSGSFRLWVGSDGTSWLDAYVTDFLSRARLAGHAVPDQAFDRALDNLRNLVNFAPDFEADTNGGGEALAYQLMVLAREGEAAMGDLRYYADVKGAEFATPLAAAQLGAALAMYGDQPRADAMFARAQAKIAPRGTAEVIRIRNDFGTQMRDISGLLTLAAEAGSQVVDRQALLDRLAAVEGPLSTQESAWTLMAASALLDDPAGPALSVDGAPLTGPLVRRLPGSAPVPVAIRNEGAVATDLTLTTLGVPEGPLAAGGYGYRIERAYYTPEGDRVSPETLASGTRLVVVLTVTPFEETRAPGSWSTTRCPRASRSTTRASCARAISEALEWLQVAGTEMTEFRSDRFLAALDWRGNKPFSLAYLVRAVSPGDYLLPAASVEDMYRPRYRANTGETRITVTP